METAELAEVARDYEKQCKEVGFWCQKWVKVARGSVFAKSLCFFQKKVVLDTKMVPFGNKHGDKSVDLSIWRFCRKGAPNQPKPARVFPWQFLEFGVVPGPGAFQCSSSQGGSPSVDQGPMVMALGSTVHPWIVSDDPYAIYTHILTHMMT